ncbi:sigma-70 family RNA polymerase sigma factor [Chryseobacterium indologenes]|uniref:Sigma-70 family RNA polymerase sigma factor n=1 Tax=Chryseobacterium indologenes TaxID=253 RepID=A0AAD0YRE1_CHRID|nr:sigma-70 family RNA polymerase sigma factor [Chryseobacterium indologenes]AZB17479.1 sigma-70 family RNA polymerase sigma factor [Chryseobacterium indologenes]
MTFFSNHIIDVEDMYKSIYNTYRERVFHYIKGKVKNRNDIRDIAQNVFFHLWEYKESLGGTNTESIIFKTCNQEISKFFKTQRKHVFENDHAIPETPDDAVDQLDSKLKKEQQLQAVQDSIELLPASSKKMFTMNKLDGVTQQKIAAELNLPKKTVQKQISEALIFLQNFHKNS